MRARLSRAFRKYFLEFLMNKNFKVVFSKARNALMVVNEATASVQHKGAKTVIAAAVASLVAGAALAESAYKDPATSATEFKTTTEQSKVVANNKFVGTDGQTMPWLQNGTLAADQNLWVLPVDKANTRLTGLYANGMDKTATNAGTIYVQANGTNTKAYQNRAMMADNGGEAVNNGTIVAKSGYGMTIGSTGTGSTITNNKSIIVEDMGVGMELGAAKMAAGVNNGTITVGKASPSIKDAYTIGVLVKGSGAEKDQNNGIDIPSTFTNYGTIDAAEGKAAISIEGQDGSKGQADTNVKVVLAEGSVTKGDINVQETVDKDTHYGVTAAIDVDAGATVEGDIKIEKVTGSEKVAVKIAGMNGVGTVHGALIAEGGETELSGELAFEQVNVAGGKVTLGTKLGGEASLTFVDPKAKANEPQISVTGNGEFVIDQYGTVTADTAKVDGGKFENKGVLTVTDLTVASATGGSPFVTSGTSNITNLTVTGKTQDQVAVEVKGGVTTVSGKVSTETNSVSAVKVSDGTLSLTETTDLSAAKDGAINLAGGTLSTDSSLFLNDKGKYAANSKVTATSEKASTISFTDDQMTLKDLQDLHKVISDDVGFEVLSTDVTKADGTALTAMPVADWKKIGGATLATVTAQVAGNDAIQLDEKFGAKNIELTGAATGNDRLSFTAAKEYTLVGGQQGTKLITSSNAKPIELADVFVTGDSTLNLGAKNNTSFTYGEIDTLVSVGANSKLNVRNGDFTLAKGLYVKDGSSQNDEGSAEIAEGAVLRLADRIGTDGKMVADGESLRNEGKVTVAGSLYAETIDQLGTLNVTGYLSAKNFTADSKKTGTTVTGGEVVLSGEKRTGANETGWNFTTGNITLDKATVTEAHGDALVEEKGSLVVLGSGVSAAEAYQQAHHLDNTVWVGQESYVDGFSFGTDADADAAKGTWNGIYTSGEKTVAFDLAALAASGYKAGADAEKTTQILTVTGTTPPVDKIYIAGLRNVQHSMLFKNADGVYQMKLGEVSLVEGGNGVAPGRVDFGTSLYDANNAFENGILSFKVDETELSEVADMGFNTFGYVDSSLRNVQFGQNQLADQLIFNWDRIGDDYDRGFYAQAKAAGLLKDDVTLQQFLGVYDDSQDYVNVVADGKDAAYWAAMNAYDKSFVANIVEAEHAQSNMAVYGGAFSTSFDINDQIRSTIDRRSSLANLNVARNASGITPWVDVMGTFNSADGLYGSSGYEADIYGATLGADYTASCGAILGAAISIGQADGNSVDAATQVDNDADFWGVSFYGSHRIGNVNGKFDIGYVSTSNDLSSSSAYFGTVKESLDADIFTVGVGAEYLATVGSLNVVPHAGIRWSSLDMDDSKYGADYDKMNLFQMPIGVAFSGTFDMTGWKVAPMLDISVVPTFGDKDAVASYTGGIKDTVRVVDSNPVQMTLGVNAQVDAWTLGVNYGLSAGSDERLNNAFNFHARYTF